MGESSSGSPSKKSCAVTNGDATGPQPTAVDPRRRWIVVGTPRDQWASQFQSWIIHLLYVGLMFCTSIARKAHMYHLHIHVPNLILSTLKGCI